MPCEGCDSDPVSSDSETRRGPVSAHVYRVSSRFVVCKYNLKRGWKAAGMSEASAACLLRHMRRIVRIFSTKEPGGEGLEGIRNVFYYTSHGILPKRLKLENGDAKAAGRGSEEAQAIAKSVVRWCSCIFGQSFDPTPVVKSRHGPLRPARQWRATVRYLSISILYKHRYLLRGIVSLLPK